MQRSRIPTRELASTSPSSLTQSQLWGDVDRLMRLAPDRRQSLRWMLGAGAVGLLGCGGGEGSTVSSTSGTTDTGTTGTTTSGSGSSGSSSTTCSLIPEETQGPYPGDGSNTSGGSVANALALSGIVRSDIRSSIAGASGVASGVPLTVTLQLVNTNGSCASLAGYAIYLWHCDAQGRYSMYSSGVTAENYLRGVQVTDANGNASFVTVFPGCYSGRYPHMHFEIYRSAAVASSYTNKLRTSQLAFPRDVCSAVYASSSLYSASVSNLAAVQLSTDGIFSDGSSSQVATTSGSVAAGYTASLQVGIAA